MLEKIQLAVGNGRHLQIAVIAAQGKEFLPDIIGVSGVTAEHQGVFTGKEQWRAQITSRQRRRLTLKQALFPGGNIRQRDFLFISVY